MGGFQLCDVTASSHTLSTEFLGCSSKSWPPYPASPEKVNSKSRRTGAGGSVRFGDQWEPWGIEQATTKQEKDGKKTKMANFDRLVSLSSRQTLYTVLRPSS